jgi:hypothetical protein
MVGVVPRERAGIWLVWCRGEGAGIWLVWCLGEEPGKRLVGPCGRHNLATLRLTQLRSGQFVAP